MVLVTLHQDVEGKKRLQTVDVPATRADWLIENGYASTAASKAFNYTNRTSVPAAKDPTNKANREATNVAPPGFPGRVPFAAKSPFRAPIATEESFDPSKFTVAEVNAHLATVSKTEQRRILRVEKSQQNRATIVAPA